MRMYRKLNNLCCVLTAVLILNCLIAINTYTVCAATSTQKYGSYCTVTWNYTITSDGDYSTITVNSITVEALKALKKNEIYFTLDTDYGHAELAEIPAMKKGASKTLTLNKSLKEKYSAGAEFAWLTTWHSDGDYKETILKQPTVYKVTYNANGGTGAPGKQIKYKGTALTLSSTRPTRQDYIFQGWNTNAAGTGTNYSSGASYTANAALTLYAKWSPVATISYNANEGNMAASHGTGYTVNASNKMIQYNGKNVTTAFGSADLYNYNNSSAVNIERPGYHIIKGKEWNSKPDGTGTSYNQDTKYNSTTFKTNGTLYANWIPNNYTISFFPNAEGASGTMPDQSCTYDRSEKIMSNAFINPGFKLAGWDMNPDADPSGSLTIRGNTGDVLNLTTKNEGHVDLYAIWRPIEDCEADIQVGKIVAGNAVTDAYFFMIEPIEGWIHENESARQSGTVLEPDKMPMPEGTPEDRMCKTVEVNGLADSAGVLRSSPVGLITFENPGWYMYKISEIVPNSANPKIRYDRTNYYVVVYVEYKDEDDYKIKVSGITAWHNTRGSTKNRPDLEDISEITDNNGKTAAENTEGVYGKTGIGINSLMVRFWNRETRDPEGLNQFTGFRISKNVTGSLGDVTKRFDFHASLTGLAANTTYSINNEGAETGTGFTGNAFRTNEEGAAELSFTLQDDEGFSVEELPVNAQITVTESESDHTPGYTVTTDDGTVVKEDRLNRHGELTTDIITMSAANDMYNIVFTNSKDLIPNTGITVRNIPVAAVAIFAFCLIVVIFLKVRRTFR